MKTFRPTYLLCAALIFVQLASVRAAPIAADDVKPALFPEADLRVAAQIVEGRQDELRRPVKADFYLLDRSVIDILKSAGFTPAAADAADDGTGSVRQFDEAAYFEALAGVLIGGEEEGENGQEVSGGGNDAETEILRLAFQTALNDHRTFRRRGAAADFSTDLSGIGRLRGVRLGSYYLFGYAPVDGHVYLWNVPVRLTVGGLYTLELDQYNAEETGADQ